MGNFVPERAFAPPRVFMGHMATASATSGSEEAELVRVLTVDHGLRDTIPPEDRELALQQLVARRVSICAGPWDDTAYHDSDALGLLVLEGLITRDVELAGTRARELLGPEDVLRPWDDDTGLSPIAPRISWTVLEPMSFAVLDRRWALLAARWPDLGVEILSRVLRRSRWLIVLLTIAGLRGVEERVMLFFWHLASNWGRVTPEGTLVPSSLTHEVIADVIGARRPSVTTAISELQNRGDLERVDDGWLLKTPPSTSAT